MSVCVCVCGGEGERCYIDNSLYISQCAIVFFVVTITRQRDVQQTPINDKMIKKNYTHVINIVDSIPFRISLTT